MGVECAADDRDAGAGADAEALPPQPRTLLDDSGYTLAIELAPRWPDPMSLEGMREAFRDVGPRNLPRLEQQLRQPGTSTAAQVATRIDMALLHLYEGEPLQAYEELARREPSPRLIATWRPRSCRR